MVSLSKIVDANWNVDSNKIWNNLKTLKSFLRRWLVFWWEKKKYLKETLIKNLSYCLSWNSIDWYVAYWPILSWSSFPIFEVKSDDWTKQWYLDLTDKTLFDYLDARYVWCFKKEVYWLFGIDTWSINFWMTPHKYKVSTKYWYITIWNWNYFLKKMVRNLWLNSELSNNLVLLKTDDWIILITLKDVSLISKYKDYLSKADAAEAANSYTVVWKFQVDSFLVNYCATNYFTWNKEEAVNILKNKE